MWVFLNNAFVSAVQHRANPKTLVVRARLPGDLERLFPDLADHVERTPRADYLFRVNVPKARFAKMLKAQVDAIDYDNFKGSVPDKFRHDTYMGVWSVMWRAQSQVSGRPQHEFDDLDFEESTWPAVDE